MQTQHRGGNRGKTSFRRTFPPKKRGPMSCPQRRRCLAHPGAGQTFDQCSLIYLDGIHAESLGNIAAEASLGRSLQSVREEFEGLRAQLTKHKLDLESTLTATLPASHARFEVPILASEVAPPEDEPSLPSMRHLACIDAHPSTELQTYRSVPS